MNKASNADQSLTFVSHPRSRYANLLWLAVLCVLVAVPLYLSGFIKLYHQSDLLSDVRDGAYPEYADVFRGNLSAIRNAGVSAIKPAGNDSGDRYRVKGLGRDLVVKVRPVHVSDMFQQAPVFKIDFTGDTASLSIHNPHDVATIELVKSLARLLESVAGEIAAPVLTELVEG